MKLMLLAIATYFSFFSSMAYSEIDSPHGLYQVSEKGITRIDVAGTKDEHGNFEVYTYVISTIYPTYIKDGMLTSRGWWSTSTQQFYTQDYDIRPGVQQCNSWGEYGWGFTFVSDVRAINGQNVALYRETGESPSGRVPERYCANESISQSTCRVHSCNEWRSPEPGRFLVDSEEIARSLFNELSRQ